MITTVESCCASTPALHSNGWYTYSCESSRIQETPNPVIYDTLLYIRVILLLPRNFTLYIWL